MRLNAICSFAIVSALLICSGFCFVPLTIAQCPPSHPRDCGGGWCCYNDPPPCEVLKGEGACVQSNPSTSTTTSITNSSSSSSSTTTANNTTTVPSTTTTNNCPNTNFFLCPDGYTCCYIFEICCQGTCCDGDEEICDNGYCRRVCVFYQIYGEDAPEVALLRKYRDQVLSKTPTGKEVIELYYQWRPFIVTTIEENEEFKEDLKELIAEILPIIEQALE